MVLAVAAPLGRLGDRKELDPPFVKGGSEVGRSPLEYAATRNEGAVPFVGCGLVAEPCNEFRKRTGQLAVTHRC